MSIALVEETRTKVLQVFDQAVARLRQVEALPGAHILLPLESEMFFDALAAIGRHAEALEIVSRSTLQRAQENAPVGAAVLDADDEPELADAPSFNTPPARSES